MQTRIRGRTLALLLVPLLLSALAWPQFTPRDTDSQVALVSGGPALKFQDGKGTVSNKFELFVNGTTPSGLTVTITGCMRGGTCSGTLATSSGTANQLLTPTPQDIYDYYRIAYTWTGGDTSTYLTINRTGTVARNGSGSGPGGGITGGPLTVNTLPLATGTQSIGNSLFTDIGGIGSYFGTSFFANIFLGNPAEPDPSYEFAANSTCVPSAIGNAKLIANANVLKVSENNGGCVEVEKRGPLTNITGATYTVTAQNILTSSALSFETNSAVVTLPNITAAYPSGAHLSIHNDTFTSQTIAATSPSTIDSAASTTIYALSTIYVVSDGVSNWLVNSWAPARAQNANTILGNCTGSTDLIQPCSITAAMLPANVKVRGVSFSIGDPAGAALTAASTTTSYVTVPFACTIAGYNLLVDAGTVTVKFWKIATGTAIPTVSNVINTSGVGIASGTAIHSATTSDFTTTTVTANDIVAMNITAVATAKYVQGVLQCNQ